MPKIQSTNLKNVDYDPNSNTLVVDFNDGRQYQYTNVPNSIYYQLIAVESKGEFFAKHIRGKFPTMRLL